MSDEQPGGDTTAAVPAGPDPEPADTGTVTTPVRWSGSAAVPPLAPKRSRWTRRRPDREAGGPAAGEPLDWATTPAVDPWADENHDWTAGPPPPLDPTRIDLPVPPTRIDPPRAAPQPEPPKPVKPAKRERGRRPAPPPVNRPPVAPHYWPQPPRYGPPPPRYGPPPYPPPSYRRRRRRWPRRLALTGLLGLLCCCGVPGYLAWAPARQWPVSAVLPATFADLDRHDDRGTEQALDQLARQLREAGAPADGVFAGVYGDGAGKRVTVFGSTGFRLAPESDVEAQVAALAGEFGLDRVEVFDLGETGAHERCGAGRANGTATVVCAWADHGSLATVLLTRRSLAESAELVARLRSSVLTRG